MRTVKSEHKKARNEALYNEYKKVMREKTCLSEDEAIDIVLSSPQPRMWVPFNSAYKILRQILYGKNNPEKRVARSSLTEDIKAAYTKLSAHRLFRQKKRPAYFLTSFILAEPSCGFYLSHARAKIIIDSIRIERQRAWREKK